MLKAFCTTSKSNGTTFLTFGSPEIMCQKKTAVLTVSLRDSTTNQHRETPSTNNKDKLQPHKMGTRHADWRVQYWACAEEAVGPSRMRPARCQITSKTHPPTRRRILVNTKPCLWPAGLDTWMTWMMGRCQWPHVMRGSVCEAADGHAPASELLGGEGSECLRRKVRLVSFPCKCAGRMCD
jgi:hypothetical protein